MISTLRPSPILPLLVSLTTPRRPRVLGELWFLVSASTVVPRQPFPAAEECTTHALWRRRPAGSAWSARRSRRPAATGN